MVRIFKRFVLCFCFVILAAGAALLAFRSRYRAEIRVLAETQIMNATSDLINDAIDKQIETGSVQYDRIVYFEKDLNGKITALKTNIGEVNRLKTDILNLINDEILALDSSNLGIPIGDLFLPELLAGRGPEIPVSIISIRNSDASFSNEFSEAGINQTLQRLLMEVSVDISVLVFGQTTSFSVSSQVVVAETVIVGQVPDTYLQTGGQYDSER